MIRRWWRFSERLACLPPVCVQRTGRRPAWRRQGGGALIFQDLDLGEALSAEAKLRPTEGGGKHLPVRCTQTGPPEAKCSGKWSIDETDETDRIDGIDQTDGIDQIDETDQCRHPP